MARTTIKPGVTQHIVTEQDTPGLATMADAWNVLDTLQEEVKANALEVAKQIGYDGPMTIGGIEDRIRLAMRRTIGECLEIGKSLLIMKELSAHGEFQGRVELLGISYRMAAKFMSATLKFSNVNSSSLLNAAGTQTKMLELLVLDDGEIDALESGNTVRGLTLDEIETLSVSELKKALRDSQKDLASKDAVIAKKIETNTALEEELARARLDMPAMAHIDWPKAFHGYVEQVNALRKAIKHNVGSLAVIAKDAMQIQAESDAEEAALERGREILAAEMVGIHNECIDMIEALGLEFDRSLGAFSDARIKLFNQQ